MDISTSNISFQAKIKTLTRCKNKSAFQKVCKEFEKATTEYPDDSLYITKTKHKAYSWHITDKKRGDYYKGEEIFTNSIDNHIEELGVKNFAKELINAFKAMKFERVIYKKTKPLKIEIDKTKGLAEAYKNLASAYEKDGNALMAKRYNYLSERANNRFEELAPKYDKYVNTFNAKITQLSKNFPEIKQVELYLP